MMRILVSVLLISGLPLPAGRSVRSAEVDFNRQIRRTLSDNCFRCHGPDEAQRETGMRLDTQEGALAELESGGFAIVPGNSSTSQLYQRITSTDPDVRMPPPESGKELTDAQIELIRQWIDQGASWDEHWAYQPPRQPPLPNVIRADWPCNPIDYFILARLERDGMQPSPEADRAMLIRRVTLDLTGLPPAPAEVDAFLEDESGDAYELLVDRLLRSTHYGEHMARYWLDAVRYADTHGLHLDNYREMWAYRDWVVKALNDNMSFSQFTIEQLAGDLLPDPTRDQLVATGFNRCHVSTSEGGSIDEEVYVRNVVDRVVTTGTVFMGMTFDCTRCHDHKYDPFSMKDFYSLFAYFNSLDGKPLDGNRKDHAPVIRVPTEAHNSSLAEYDQKIAVLESQLRDPWPELDQLQLAWEKELAAARLNGQLPQILFGDWHTVGPFPDRLEKLYNAQKHGPEGHPIDLEQEFDASGRTVKWQRRADWTDGKPHTDLPGKVAANFLYRTITVTEARTLPLSLGSDDGIKVFLNDNEVFKNEVTRNVAPDQEKLEVELRPGENHLLIKIINHEAKSGFYFSLNAENTVTPIHILTSVGRDPSERSGEQKWKLREHFRNHVASLEALKEVRDELASLREARADVDRRIATTLVWREQKTPRPAYMLARGQYDQPGDQVPRTTPAILPPLAEDAPSNRLGLAQWLVDPGHPLTSRVAVNRFWQQIFGTGLVKTAENFGSQGEPPSHPRLLDWLAVQFSNDDWNIQQTVKRIVMSATYRQSSRMTGELLDIDPANRLLARGPRFRLDAETLRDQALAVSGLLVTRMGGYSVKPPQPDGLWYAVGYSGSDTVRFQKDTGADKVYRRTLYTFIKRTAPPPQMSTFDAPSRESCVMRRERTNTPLQALLLMNDPQYVEAARRLAERTVREGGEDVRQRAAYMLRLCTARHPESWEVDELVDDFREHLAEYEQDVDAARQVIHVGESQPDPALDVSHLAAWTLVANLVLNLDEVICKN